MWCVWHYNSWSKMRFCTSLLTFTIDSWLPFTNAVSTSKQLTYCVQCYCYPRGWKPKLQWHDKVKWLHLSFFFFCLFESLVLVEWTVCFFCVFTTVFCTLSTHCLTWPPPNRSPSTAPSWLSDHPQGLGRAIRACVHWHILSEEGWEVWGVRRGGTLFFWTRKLWIMLALPGRAQREPAWANWTQAGRLSRSSASCWHQAGGEQFIPTLAEAGHASPLLTRLAHCRHFPLLGSVVSLGCRYALHW